VSDKLGRAAGKTMLRNTELEGNLKMELKEMGCVYVEWIQLAEALGRLLRTQFENFAIHRRGEFLDQLSFCQLLK
jgi:hypothetical protein